MIQTKEPALSGRLAFDDHMNIYDITTSGGPENGGIAYRIHNDGSGYTVLHKFAPDSDPWYSDEIKSEGGLDSFGPQAGLIRAKDGNFCGTNANSGDVGNGMAASFTG